MKKLIIIFLLFVAHCMWAQLPSNENYIYTKNYLSADGSKKTETVQYFDGLGRAKEVVQVKATVSGKDLVAPVIYDQSGRQSKTLLPIPVTTSNYGIHNTTEGDVNSYYGVTNAFSQQEIEASPLARVFEVANPGTEWAMSSGHTTKMQYLTNIESDQVKRYNTEVSWANATLSTTISSITLYNPNQLSKNVVTDEDGKITTEFKNSEGQTILLRKGTGSGKLDTYYIYNVYNQLAFVISPKAEQQIAANNNVITSQILNELCYQYVYDNRFRQVEKKLPGKGWEYMVYDQQNRMVASQDANMKNNAEQPNRWLFSRYDQFGRVVYTGKFIGGTRLQEQTNANAKGLNNENRNTASFTLNGQEIFYTNTAYPSAAFVPYTVNYYDTYTVTTGNAPTFYPLNTDVLEFYMINEAQSFSSNGVNSTRSLKSMPTSSFVKNLDDDNWSASHIWYDALLRPVGSRSVNHLGGYTNAEKQLDFSGAVLKANTYHKKTNADPSEVVIKERFVYDDQFRMKQHYHQVNGNPEELLSDYTYNDLGQVTTKKVGNNLQSIDYTYNIRGILTKVNNPDNLGTDLFGYELKFASTSNTSVATANYNGNITEMIWKNAAEDVLKKYSYQYDNYNRLTAALYQEPNSTLPQSGLYNETMNYDFNGNITDLKRNQKGYDGFFEEIDELEYGYNGNRLTSVVDHKNNYSGYPDTSGNTISYDLNGNMTNHVDKGILEIKYNDFNLPKYIKFNNFVPRVSGDVYQNISYAYRADGVKIKKIHHYFSGRNRRDAFATTEYIDGFQYKNDTGLTGAYGLQFFATSEGYFDFVNNRYIYHYSDHLGNVRVSFTREGNTAAIVQQNDYYAFGLRYREGVNAGGSYNYEYNGKEMQKEIGMYDYGARFYMPDLGRWGVVDPLAEIARRFTPYHYGNNNPVRFIDPDGRSTQTFTGGDIQNAFYQFYFSGSVSSIKGGSSFGSSGGDNVPMFYNDEAGMMMTSALGNDGQGGGGSSLSSWMQNNISQFGKFNENLFSINFQQKGSWDSDKDGKLSKREADRWGFEGKGADLYVDNSYIDWKGLTIPEGKKIGDIFAISTTDAFIYLPYETAATYGGTSFRVTGKNKVEVINQEYHYKMRPANSAENIGRNILTKIGFPKTMELYNGKFIPYTIKYINPTIIIK